MLTADSVVRRMNERMMDKNSDVRFFWSATEGSDTDPTGYFLLWGYLKSKFTRHNPCVTSVFLFKGMPTMLEPKIHRDDKNQLDLFEAYVKNSFEENKDEPLDSELVQDLSREHEAVNKKIAKIREKWNPKRQSRLRQLFNKLLDKKIDPEEEKSSSGF